MSKQKIKYTKKNKIQQITNTTLYVAQQSQTTI